MRRLRVLLADDEDALRAVFRRVLEARGMEVVGDAADGAELVELSREIVADIVLTDLRMPVMDGMEAARQILARPSPPLVVIVSAYADPSLVEEAREVGVADWLKKGLRPQELCARVLEIAGQQAVA